MKILLYILTTLLTDLYFFPIEAQALPGINSKMVLAALGLVWFIINLTGKHRGKLDTGFSTLSLIALVISIISFASVTINNTFDDTYVTYIVSMWVWLGGAYFVVQFIQAVHGRISIELVANYLIAVCVAQCLVSFIMTQYTPLRNWVDSTLGGEAYMRGYEDRVYGIGAALDVAGIRFSGILVVIAFLTANLKSHNTNSYFSWYVLSFIFITIMGSIIGRSTMIGAIIGLCYWTFIKQPLSIKNIVGRRWGMAIAILLITITTGIYLYNTNNTFHNNIRFGFEGFFSWIETGEWRTNSTDILKTMVVFPESLHTWLIGDGYIENPSNNPEIAPYYTGEIYPGFYMNTDIGYLRFIFYFGLPGTLAFIALFVCAFYILQRRFPAYRWLFLLILAVNLICWIKVSSDIFPLFALFLCISPSEARNSLDANTLAAAPA